MPEIRILHVDESLVDPFLGYARAYGARHDDSYLAPEDIARFDPRSEPAVIALDDNDSVVGAASLMLLGYAEEGTARFRILHALYPEHYPALVDAVMTRVPEPVDRVFLFLPEHAGEVQDALGELGFGVCRRAYVLRHPDPRSAIRGEYPSETQVRLATAGVASDWASVVNAAFHGQPGRYDMTYERAGELLSSPRVLREATLIAYRGGIPAGVVLTMIDASDPSASEIETLGVTPGHQGMGVGRALLHDAVSAAGRHGCRWVTLSVSTFNRRAVAMYLDSGFRAEDIRVCWERTRG
ncbi:MAG: GNAT family N-acetyltransferase [Coriobacteriia bacterium]|nr:GNAT family N-acetyltransferase [Coriobacteriia bacterium]